MHDQNEIASLRTAMTASSPPVIERIRKTYIDLNSSPNGVALPNKPGIPEGGYHPKIHNREYYRKVLDLLHGATTKEEALGTLKKIADQLSKSQFPK